MIFCFLKYIHTCIHTHSAVAAATSKTIPSAVTFEIYEANKAGPLESKYPAKSGYERNGKDLGADYEILFKGLKTGISN